MHSGSLAPLTSQSWSYHEGASDQRQQVPADRQEDQQAVEVEDGGWSSGPGQRRLGSIQNNMDLVM